jgi:hypothetical protein
MAIQTLNALLNSDHVPPNLTTLVFAVSRIGSVCRLAMNRFRQNTFRQVGLPEARNESCFRNLVKNPLRAIKRHGAAEALNLDGYVIRGIAHLASD